MPENLELSSEDCQRLLRAGTAGRVAVSSPEGPHIVPVNYAVSATRSSSAPRRTACSALTRATACWPSRSTSSTTTGSTAGAWSRAVAARSSTTRSSSTLRTRDAPRAWASGARDLYLRLPLTELTGRKLGAGMGPAATALPGTPRRCLRYRGGTLAGCRHAADPRPRLHPAPARRGHGDLLRPRPAPAC